MEPEKGLRAFFQAHFKELFNLLHKDKELNLKDIVSQDLSEEGKANPKSLGNEETRKEILEKFKEEWKERDGDVFSAMREFVINTGNYNEKAIYFYFKKLNTKVSLKVFQFMDWLLAMLVKFKRQGEEDSEIIAIMQEAMEKEWPAEVVAFIKGHLRMYEK